MNKPIEFPLQKDKYNKTRLTPGQRLTSLLSYVSEHEERSTPGHRYFYVKCNCGVIFDTRIDRIKQGKGCGKCSARQRWLTFGKDNPDLPKAALLRDYRRQASSRGLTFELSQEAFDGVILCDCFYCGAAPSNQKRAKTAKLVYNGLDRRDNSKGYTEGNVVPCCWRCNMMKNKMTEQEFLTIITRIYERMIRRA